MRIKKAFHEAITDTFVGTIINLPINYILLWIAFRQEWSAALTTIVMTSVFTIVAICRKMYIRLKFEKRYLNEGINNATS